MLQLQDGKVNVQKEQKQEFKNDKKAPTTMINDLSEADMEYLISKYPEHFIEKGLSLSRRQMTLGENRIDLLFKDARGAYLIVEIQKGLLDRKHLYRMLDYHDDLKIKYPNDRVELMIIANEIRGERKEKLKNHDIEFREIRMSEFIKFAETHDELGNLQSTKGRSVNQDMNTDNQPNDWAKAIKKSGTQTGLTDTKRMQLELWNQFKEYAIKKGAKINLSKAYHQNFYGIYFGVPRTRIELTVNTQANLLGCEIYIPNSKELYHSYHNQKDEIQKELGVELQWKPMPKNKASRIMITRKGYIDNRESWDEYLEWFLDQVLKFQKVFPKYVKK